MAGQRRGVAARGLHSDGGDLTVLGQPPVQVPVAGRGRPEGRRSDPPAQGVEDRDGVAIGVGVDPTYDVPLASDRCMDDACHVVPPVVRDDQSGLGGHNSDGALVGGKFL